MSAIQLQSVVVVHLIRMPQCAGLRIPAAALLRGPFLHAVPPRSILPGRRHASYKKELKCSAALHFRAQCHPGMRCSLSCSSARFRWIHTSDAPTPLAKPSLPAGLEEVVASELKKSPIGARDVNFVVNKAGVDFRCDTTAGPDDHSQPCLRHISQWARRQSLHVTYML